MRKEQGELAVKAVDFLRNNIARADLTPAMVAQHVGVPLLDLNRWFKSFYDMSVANFIRGEKERQLKALPK